MLPIHRIALAPFLLLAACSEEPVEDSVPLELPPVDSVPVRDTSTTWTFEDTAGPDLDETPANFLHVYQDGDWTLSPSGGPYLLLTGTLLVVEFLDVERPADTADSPLLTDTGLREARLCSLSYLLEGEVADPPCDTCTASFDVTHTLTEGDPSTCHDPDLPAAEETRRMGIQDDGWIVYDYGGSGAWLPWYRAEQVGDVVTFSWQTVLGIAVEEEETE